MRTCGFQRKDNERCTDTVVFGTPAALSLDPQSLQTLPDILYFSMVWRSSCSSLGCLDEKLGKTKGKVLICTICEGGADPVSSHDRCPGIPRGIALPIPVLVSDCEKSKKENELP